MNIIFKFILLLALTIFNMYSIKKFIESIFNVKQSFTKKNYYDTNCQHQSIVCNTETEKLEADNSIILPFN